MAKVHFIITDARDENGRLGAEVEAHSDDREDRTSVANIVAFYLADQWDEVVSAARSHALTAFTAALKAKQADTHNGHQHDI